MGMGQGIYYEFKFENQPTPDFEEIMDKLYQISGLYDLAFEMKDRRGEVDNSPVTGFKDKIIDYYSIDIKHHQFKIDATIYFEEKLISIISGTEDIDYFQGLVLYILSQYECKFDLEVLDDIPHWAKMSLQDALKEEGCIVYFNKNDG